MDNRNLKCSICNSNFYCNKPLNTCCHNCNNLKCLFRCKDNLNKCKLKYVEGSNKELTLNKNISEKETPKKRGRPKKSI